MRVCLVNPPLGATSTADLAPPSWALLLGAIAREEGCEVSVLDLNLDGLERPGVDAESFYVGATQAIGGIQPDVVCCSSMGINSHVALELGRRIKQQQTGLRVLVGGAHFGSIAKDVMVRYPWIDGVCVGEAERPFRQLLRGGREWLAGAEVAVEGMLLRNQSGIAGLGTRQTPGEHEIPSPGYDLVDLERYFRVNPRRLLDLDAATRGCAQACTYCYSKTHYGRGARFASLGRFLAEWVGASRAHAEHLFVVNDDFVGLPTKTIELCGELERSGTGLTFHCYATLPRLTPPVVDSLARAGCRGVYVGVDVVHPVDRARFVKRLFTDEPDMIERADLCRHAGIVPTLAFILHEVDSPAAKDQFEATVGAALTAAARGFPIRLNTLTLYPGTVAFAEHTGQFRPSDLKPRLTMDLPEVVCDNPLAADAPSLFPFHATHRPPDVQGPFLLAVQSLFVLANCYPEHLLRFARRQRCWDLAGLVTAGLAVHEVAKLPVGERTELYLERFRALLRREPAPPARPPGEYNNGWQPRAGNVGPA